MNTKLLKQDLAEGYSSPYVEVIHIKSEGFLCGSFQGSEIPKYDDEDVWEDN